MLEICQKNMEENNVNAGANEPVGTQTFDDFLKLEGNQAEFDKRVSKALSTREATLREELRKQWEIEQDEKLSEAEKLASMNEKQKHDYEMRKAEREKNEAIAELNSYKLKEQALKIAGEKGLDISLLDYFDYRNLKAEEIGEKIDSISTAFNNAVEKAVNERLKEKTPVSQNQTQNSPIKTIPTII